MPLFSETVSLIFCNEANAPIVSLPINLRAVFSEYVSIAYRPDSSTNPSVNAISPKSLI